MGIRKSLGLEREREPINSEEIIGEDPLKEMAEEERAGIYKEYQEAFKLEKGTKAEIKGFLTEEIKQKINESERLWFEANKDKMKKLGIDIKLDGKDEGYIMRMNELLRKEGKGRNLVGRTKTEWANLNKDIENVIALREEIEKGSTSLDVQFLTLNILNTRSEGIEGNIEETKKNIEKIEKQGGKANVEKAELRAKELELEELFETRQKLAKSIKGKDLREGAKEELDRGGVKTERTDEDIKEIKRETKRKAQREWNQKILRKGKEMILMDGKEFFTVEGLADHILQCKLQESLPGIEEKIKNIMEGEIKNLGESLRGDGAGKRIEKIYGRVKRRVIDGWVEENISEKRGKDLEKLERNFEEKGIDVPKLFGGIYERTGSLANLTGEMKMDSKFIGEYLKEARVLTEEEGGEFLEWLKKSKKGKKYGKKIVKDRMGFVEFMTDLISGFTERK